MTRLVLLLAGLAPVLDLTLLPTTLPDTLLVLDGATLIDGTDQPPRPRSRVVVQNGWIAAVGDRDSISVPRGARVVRLEGKYLVPGFIDMHAHVAIAPWVIDSAGGRRQLRFPYDEQASVEVLRTQLAFGVTTVRNPAGPTEAGVTLRNRIRLGELAGPRLFTAGWPLDRVAMADRGVSIAGPEQARAEVRRQAGAGVDYVKLYAGLGPEAVAAGVDEAHRLGVRAIGHLWQTTWTEAAEAGIDGIMHVVPGAAALLPSAARDGYTRSIRGSQFMFDWFRHADFDGPEIQAMIEALRRRSISIDPTLVAFEMIARSDDSSYAAESRRFTPPSLLRHLSGERLLTLGWTPADFRSAREMLPRMLAFAKKLNDEGVLLTVGTDAANGWFLAREMELLVEAGIPAPEVLRMATRNGAMALGRIAEFGTVEVGKRADLAILDADPLVSIGNARRVAAVVVGGNYAAAATYLPKRLR